MFPAALAGEPLPLHQILKNPFIGTVVPAGNAYLVVFNGSSLRYHPPIFIIEEPELYSYIQSELFPVLSSIVAPEFDAEYSFIFT